MWRDTMYEAEAAATLLNKLSCISPSETYFEVLSEGNLEFDYRQICLSPSGADGMESCFAESLCFRDGSRALRVMSENCENGWTRWTALQPFMANPLQ